MRRLAGAVAVAVLWSGLLAAPLAHADGAADCGVNGSCAVFDSSPSAPAVKSGGKSKGSKDPSPGFPSCAGFRNRGGIAVLPGMDLSALPIDGDYSGWVRIRCVGSGGPDDLLWLWTDPRVNAEQVARTLLARMQLRPIEIGLTPKGADPMALVGLPVWLWVDEPGRLTWGPASISAGGMSLTAQVESVVWEMGDGTTTRCGKGTPWRTGTGGAASPTCGHVYDRQGSFTVRATSQWVARWSGYGESGTIRLSLSASQPLDVGEVQVIVTDR